ncbi:hypothetical protein PG990_013249 [Apiospora arundinis]
MRQRTTRCKILPTYVVVALPLLFVVAVPVVIVIECHKQAAAVCKVAGRRCRAKLRRLRSKPLLPTDPQQQTVRSNAVGGKEEGGEMITTTPNKSKTKTKTSFLDLPPEIRHQIYDWALGEPCVVQPRPGDGSVNWGARPPSDALHRIITYFGGRTGQLPREYSIVGGFRDEFRLVCGDQPAWLASTISGFKIVVTQGPRAPRHLSLMRTCRAVYGELFERLYGQNTVSLCGQGMLDWVSREWPLAGLARVRYVHAALLVDAAWGRKRQRQSLEKAVRTLRDALPGMQQLDLEIAIWSEQHKLADGGVDDADWFWACLCGILAQHLTPTAQTATTKGGRREKGGKVVTTNDSRSRSSC